MNRPPLVTKLTRIIAEQLKNLAKPMHAFLTALNDLFGPPPGPPQPPRPKPRHNYRYVCAELMRLYYRGYEFAL